MQSWRILVLTGFAFLATQSMLVGAAKLSRDGQAKVDKAIVEVQAWASDPDLVRLVIAYNQEPPKAYDSMTQKIWESLDVRAPLVREKANNKEAALLKAWKKEIVSEAFLSGADGTKIAFLEKPSNWSHKGMAKHEMPMSGKIWQGPVELDKSTGLRQVQVSVPVFNRGEPIGSLTVGLILSKLK